MRLLPLDWLRGFVMVLMAVDHASGAFNGGRLFTDAAFMYTPGTPLAADQFLTRWVTHLCAPTFVFLAGAALALSITRRLAAGEPAARIDRYILTRGLFILALDPLWMSFAFMPGKVLLQVMYAIGGSLICMAALRRLPAGTLAALGLALVVVGEGLVDLTLRLGGGPTIAGALLVTGGDFGWLIVGYPLVHWLAIMMLGWALGRRLAEGAPLDARRALVAGLAVLALFAVVRGANGYGNMHLLREDHTLVQWLHVSKYPPSLSYTALELGLMALALAALIAVSARPGAARALRPLGVLGATALFFYLLHAHLLEGAAHVFGVHRGLGLGSAWLGGAAIVLALLPLCGLWRRYKSAHPDGWARYV